MGTPRTVVAKLVGRALSQLEPLKDVRSLGGKWQSGREAASAGEGATITRQATTDRDRAGQTEEFHRRR